LSAFRPAAASAEALGAEVCADCHSAIVESYCQSAMARALGPIEAGELEGFGTTEVPGGPYAYRFFKTPPGSPFPAALLETHASEPQHEFPVPLTFAIGAGVRDRAFVAQLGQSQRFAPLEVQTHGDLRRPEPAPGHSIDPYQRWSQGITNECLGCHTADLPPYDYPLDLAATPGGWSPHGIGCHACHGDGAGHALAMEAKLYGETAPAVVSGFLATGQLERIQRLSVCAACHLQGDARILFDHRQLGIPAPGRDLLEQRAVFVAREAGAEIGFVSHVERLALSKCFTGSQMVCETCHDPHRDLQEPSERARTRAACSACHLEAIPADQAPADQANPQRPTSAPTGSSPAGPCGLAVEKRGSSDCVSCHLRNTPVFDVAHVTIHDHWIRTRPGAPSPPPQRLRTLEAPNGDWRLFAWPDGPPPRGYDDPGLWLLAREGAGLLAELPADLDLNQGFGPISTFLPNAWHVRGSLAERLGQVSLAEASYRQALVLDPDFAPSGINLALLLGLNGKTSEGLALLDRLLERYPRAAPALRNRAVLLAQLGQADAAAAALERAITIAPNAAVASALAAHYQAKNQPERAALLQAQARLLGSQ
jgi:hypothetical protein